MDRDKVSVHKNAKKELGQHPAILTEQAWSITYISYSPLLSYFICFNLFMFFCRKDPFAVSFFVIFVTFGEHILVNIARNITTTKYR